jgi:hypothetical protein
MDFLSWFFQKLKSRVCPHCDRPIFGTVVKGCHVYAHPCKCLLYRITVEPAKVASLDEYRSARNSYLEIKKEHPSFGFPFKVHCLFWSRYKGLFKAKLRQRLRQSRGESFIRSG